jgi:hypothetical protein
VVQQTEERPVVPLVPETVYLGERVVLAQDLEPVNFSA